jgi:hypothetical protein
MGKAPPPKDFVFSDDDDEQVEGGGIPDDDGWIHLEGKPNGLSEGDSRKRKAVANKPELVRRAVKRASRRRPGGA